jgi:ParB/RepB/Spo0J family partition protein
MPTEAEKSKDLVTLIKVTELIESPYQARFEEAVAVTSRPETASDILQLAKSIEQSGLMQPIIVRKVGKGYEIIDGHRRVQAMRRLGRGQIMAIVREASDREAQIMHVIGNLQRKNLKPVELAITYQKLLDTKVFKDKRELSKAIAKDETYIGDLLSTLQLDSRIIEDLAKNNLIKDLRVLRLIRLYAPVDNNGKSNSQWELYRKVLFTKMSRKELALLVKKPGQTPALNSWKIKSSYKKITVQLETGPIDKARKEKLIQLIAQKLKEIKEGME